jgi:hypothetical protein
MLVGLRRRVRMTGSPVCRPLWPAWKQPKGEGSARETQLCKKLWIQVSVSTPRLKRRDDNVQQQPNRFGLLDMGLHLRKRWVMQLGSALA